MPNRHSNRAALIAFVLVALFCVAGSAAFLVSRRQQALTRTMPVADAAAGAARSDSGEGARLLAAIREDAHVYYRSVRPGEFGRVVVAALDAPDDRRVVTVNLLPCEVWVAEFDDAMLLANAALELGNLHLPVEATANGQLVTPPHGPARGVLDRHAKHWRPEVQRFQPLRATVLGTGGNLRLAESFELKHAAATVTAPASPASQLTNSRE